MRIKTKPKVYLVGRPSIAEGFNQFLEDEELGWPTEEVGSIPAVSQITELCGRICYMSFGNKAVSPSNERYVSNLLGMNEDGTFKEGPAHGSVIEHCNFNFIVTGAGRGFSHEQARHRVGWSLSQISTRYCDFEREGEDGDMTWEPGFVIPPLALTNEETRRDFAKRIEETQQFYKELLPKIEADLKSNSRFMEGLSKYDERTKARIIRKAARGSARDILPIATEAILGMSGNPRSIWNTLYLRGSEHAEGAIREVYVQIAKIMKVEFPAVFKGVTFETLWDGSEAVILPRPNL